MTDYKIKAMPTAVNVGGQWRFLSYTCLYTDNFRGHITCPVITLATHILHWDVKFLQHTLNFLCDVCTCNPSKFNKCQKFFPNVATYINKSHTNGKLLCFVRCDFICTYTVKMCLFNLLHYVTKNDVLTYYI